MNRIFIGSLLLSAAAVFLSCRGGEDIPELRKGLLETDRAFSEYSLEQGSEEAFYRFMDDEGIVLPRRGIPIRGKESYRKLFDGLPDSGRSSRLQWEPEIAEVSRSGDMGYTFGRYTQTVTDALGSVDMTSGYYVTIWKRQADGSWKFIFDTGNETPSADK